MSSGSTTIFIVCMRVLTGLISSASLSLYAIIVAKVFDYRFPAIEPWMTSLPIFALGISIIYNALIIFLANGSPHFTLASDLIIAALLVALGTTGFVLDNVHYFNNGLWRQYNEGPWLTQEIWAASLLIAAVVLHIILAFMGYWRRSASKMGSNISESAVEPPAYYQSQADFYQVGPDSELGSFVLAKLSFEKDKENVNEKVMGVETKV